MKRVSVFVIVFSILAGVYGCKKSDKKSEGKPDFDKICNGSLKKMIKCMPEIATLNKNPPEDQQKRCIERITKTYITDRVFYDKMMNCYKIEDCKKFVPCIMKNSRKEMVPNKSKGK